METPLNQDPSKIKLLPEHIIDQIKAGEVIERPSTLIKEILENSIDAKSSKIDIHIIDNGIELISLEDNGDGISPEDLPLAFCRHATSKIENFEDIYRLYTYGFRGEALASIASISRITCETSTPRTTSKIQIEGGETLSGHSGLNPSPQNTGTKLYIKDLFYNTPVRMKFIQSKTSEKNQIKKILEAFLLTHPSVGFSIKWDDKDKEFYPARDSQLDRIKDVLKVKSDQGFKSAEGSYDGTHFKLFYSLESSRGNAHKNHNIFVNNRLVKDIQIHKIILNSLNSEWPDGETGNYIAFLSTPADEIDVNIHPNKIAIKFFKASQVFSLLSGTIKSNIRKSLSQGSGEAPQKQETFLDTNFQENKEIDYKKINFDNKDDVNEYLENIHFSTSSSKAEAKSIDFQTLSIISHEQKYYLIDRNLLLNNEVIKLLTTQDDDENIPLLVSRPIKLTKPINSKTKDFLEQLGFEIDQINTDALLLRTFPKRFQKLPYLRIIEEAISRNLNHSNYNKIFIKINDDHSYKLDELIRSHGFTNLLSQRIIIPLKEEDLLKIYEKR